MGDCQSKGTAVDPKEIENDRMINFEMRKKRMEEQAIIKLLLLGAGESGKSTIFKQLRVIHQNNFSDDERKHYSRLIRANVIENLRALYKGAEAIGMILDEHVTKEHKFVMDFNLDTCPFDESVAAKVKVLWHNQSFRQTFDQRSKFQLSDSAFYFFENIDRVAEQGYLPTNQDIFHTRVRTTGIHEIQFTIELVQFRLTDVGGQRSERRKWIHCFEDVTAVVFVAAISEYDQLLLEDNKTNRMKESLDLFSEISHSRWFENTAMILFLNKEDLFKQKLATIPLSTCFPDYEGGDDYKQAVKYIETKFMELNKKDKQLYIHVTCATNTGNIRFVFDAVKDIILEYNVLDSGMM